MILRRILPPLLLGYALLMAVVLVPAHWQTAPSVAKADTATSRRYVATTGTDDSNLCTDPAAPCRTVQHAVDVAIPGDEVRVAAGLYDDLGSRQGVTQTLYIDKSIFVRGGFTTTTWSSPDAFPMPRYHETVLDARREGRVVYVTGTLSSGGPVVLEGLHLVGGDAAGLGGDPMGGYDVGGGVYVADSYVQIFDSFIIDNRADHGGGIYVDRSPVQLLGNEVISNTAGFQNGGGVFLFHSSDADVRYNNISRNSATSYGGGLKSDNTADLILAYNTIAENSAWSGGGVEIYSGTLRANANIVYGNVVSSTGGGITLDGVPSARLDNVVLFDNQADDTGAGAYLIGSRVAIRHGTIVRNGTNGNGDGTALSVGASGYTSTLAISNTLIVSHSVGIAIEPGSAAATIGTLWWGNDTNVVGTVVTQTPDLRAVPRFRAPWKHDYRLRPSSPAIDAGITTTLKLDGEGEPRPYGPAPDIGADEVPYGFIDPAEGWNFVYTDTEGVSLTMDAPPGSVVSPTRIVFTRNTTPGHEITGSLQFAGIAFDLAAYLDQQGDLPEDGFTFDKPVTITLRYRDEDVVGINEQSLRLYFWTGSYWKDIAEDCQTTYTRDPANNTIYAPICHLSAFGMHGVGSTHELFVPLIVK